jgi:hypothetical protein
MRDRLNEENETPSELDNPFPENDPKFTDFRWLFRASFSRERRELGHGFAVE